MAAASDSNVRHIAEASQKLNYPGANKLYSHLKANSQYVQYKHIQAHVERQPEHQIFTQHRRAGRPRQTGPIKQRPPNLAEGRVPAMDINDRWMADLVDLTAQPSIEPGSVGTSPYQYILVVLNVFSKQLWVRALRTKTPAVVTEAFKEILNGESSPSRLDTDSGSEFTGPFAKLLEEKKIWL